MNYFDTLFAKKLAGGGGGGGGGTAMYRHDVWFTSSFGGDAEKLYFSLVTDNAVPFTSYAGIAEALYAKDFTASGSGKGLQCSGIARYSGDDYLIVSIASPDGIDIWYNGPRTSSWGTTFYGGALRSNNFSANDIVTAL